MVSKSTKSRVGMKCPKCEHTFLPDLKEKQSRAGKSARRKGAQFENKLAKKFKAWWPGDHDFKRTPMSGGSALKEGWGLAGDICTTAPDFPAHLELKNAPSSFAGLHQFFTAPKFAVWDWLEQAKKDCPPNKKPILIFNRYDQPTYCASDSDYWILSRLTKCSINYMTFKKKDRFVLVWLLNDMFSSDPEVWKDDTRGN